jgi:hypothetical protein
VIYHGKITFSCLEPLHGRYISFALRTPQNWITSKRICTVHIASLVTEKPKAHRFVRPQ